MKFQWIILGTPEAHSLCIGLNVAYWKQRTIWKCLNNAVVIIQKDFDTWIHKKKNIINIDW